MLQSGQTFAQFKILRKLGEGGMGAVYLAEDQKLGREVALKILAADFLGDDERRARFEREARVAASISHPHVMGIFDLGTTEDPETGNEVVYIVMELIRGAELGAYLRDKRPGMSATLRLAEKIASGLAAAHKLNIVHRDLKPDNVMVNEDGDPKILDFGLAKPVAEPFQELAGDVTMDMGEPVTKEMRVMGTVQYMSPEQAQGKNLDTRSDIFSFGVLLYRLATGKTPFAGDTEVSTLAKIIEGTHQPASASAAEIHPELDRIIDKCLQKDPGDRYQDTRDLAVDLRQLRRQHESGVTASTIAREPVSAPGKSSSFGRWLPRGAAILAVAAIAVFALTKLAWREQVPAADAGESQLAILSFENKTGDDGLAWMATGLPEILLTDLSQCEGLSLISRDRVEDVLAKDGKDPKDASRREWLAASRRLGATSILSGSYFKLGEKIRIDARLEDVANGRILFGEKVVGDDPFALVDSLTGLITAELHVTGEGPGGSVADIMTASPEAFREYHVGTEMLLAGLDEEAVPHFERAITLDSEFALPYLRMAMYHMFNGRNQQGLTYLQQAVTRKDKLPPREKSLLGIYTDIWLHQQFGEAYAKMDAFVQAYPDDKEALSIYGAIVVGFSADTTKGFAQYEKVLSMDPTYPLALQLYAQGLQNFGEYDRAIVLVERLRKAFPDSPDFYEILGDLYVEKKDYDRALSLFEEFRRRFPNDPEVINNMASLALRKGEVKRARGYAEEIPRIKPDDVQWLMNYESIMGNLDTWEGNFQSALDHYRRMNEHAYAMGDTVRIYSTRAVLGTYLERFEKPVEAMREWEIARKFAPPFNRLNYPHAVLRNYPERAQEVRDELLAAIEVFKEHTPPDLWKLVDTSLGYFDAAAAKDTAAMIAHHRGILELPPNQRGPNHDQELGELLVLTGKPEEALPHLEESAETTNAWRYLVAVYWMGRAHEAMGEGGKAADRYEELLRHWGDADIELEQIRGARKRLAGLTG